MSEQIKQAATNLYMAGKWGCPNLNEADQSALWEALRDALGIPEGTATAVHRGAINTRATPKVKSLDWAEWGTEGASKIYKAYGVGTIYKITLHQDNSGSTFAVSAGRKAERLTQDTTSVVSLDRLKAVAQAHHEARILEALV